MKTNSEQRQDFAERNGFYHSPDPGNAAVDAAPWINDDTGCSMFADESGWRVYRDGKNQSIPIASGEVFEGMLEVGSHKHTTQDSAFFVVVTPWGSGNAPPCFTLATLQTIGRMIEDGQRIIAHWPLSLRRLRSADYSVCIYPVGRMGIVHGGLGDVLVLAIQLLKAGTYFIITTRIDGNVIDVGESSTITY